MRGASDAPAATQSIDAATRTPKSVVLPAAPPSSSERRGCHRVSTAVSATPSPQPATSSSRTGTDARTDPAAATATARIATAPRSADPPAAPDPVPRTSVATPAR